MKLRSATTGAPATAPNPAPAVSAAPVAVAPRPPGDQFVAPSFLERVAALSTRATVRATARAMTEPGALQRALARVQPPIDLTQPSISGAAPMIPQLTVGPLTQAQVDQLRQAGFSLDCLNPLSRKKGEIANWGLRDGDTLWRAAVKPASHGTFTVGFYGETLPRDAPQGQGARHIPFTSAVVRAGGDQAVGERPTLINRLGNLLFRAATALGFPRA